jgi:hypothetical protein
MERAALKRENGPGDGVGAYRLRGKRWLGLL